MLLRPMTNQKKDYWNLLLLSKSKRNEKENHNISFAPAVALKVEEELKEAGVVKLLHPQSMHACKVEEEFKETG